MSGFSSTRAAPYSLCELLGIMGIVVFAKENKLVPKLLESRAVKMAHSGIMETKKSCGLTRDHK